MQSESTERIYGSYVTDKMKYERSYGSSAYRKWSDSTYRQIGDWLPGSRSARILDVGCGHGNVLHMLRAVGYENIEGVDLSEEQLELARRITPRVYNGDAIEHLEANPDSYDLILAFDLIEHFDKERVLRFLAAVRSALVPGGSVVLQTPNAASPFGCEQRYHDFTHETAFDPHGLSHVLRLSGFSTVECRETGPVIHGLRSAIRWILWKSIRLGLVVWNLSETGSSCRVLTRVFRARAVRE